MAAPFTAPLPAAAPSTVDRLASSRIDWGPDFWNPPETETEWLIEPFVARGRGHALYAPGKTGKSLLLLNVAARAATGRPVLDQPAGEPLRVLYADYEMTRDDVRERLEDMGFSSSDDLSAFAYYALPDLLPLDTALGGQQLLELAMEHRAELVIIDTISRAISGQENSADTLRSFFRHTGSPLKARGIAVVRADHAGKDLDRGARGTSAKVDDVDVVWELRRKDGGRFDLKSTHKRMGWVPDVVHLDQTSEPLGYRTVTHAWPAGTANTAKVLDRLGVPLTLGKVKVRVALKEAGETAPRHEVILAAQRFRRNQQDRLESSAADLL